LKVLPMSLYITVYDVIGSYPVGFFLRPGSVTFVMIKNKGAYLDEI